MIQVIPKKNLIQLKKDLVAFDYLILNYQFKWIYDSGAYSCFPPYSASAEDATNFFSKC